jgi:hypothetical protein
MYIEVPTGMKHLLRIISIIRMRQNEQNFGESFILIANKLLILFLESSMNPQLQVKNRD